jgi:hypothetical protein
MTTTTTTTAEEREREKKTYNLKNSFKTIEIYNLE